MYRIDNATAVESLPVAGAVGPNPNGYFTNGNPSPLIDSTIVDQDWLNTVQEELCNVITAAGLTLNKATRTQLLQALGSAGKNIQLFGIPGSTPFTVPAGITKINGQAWGAGGGSGGVSGLTNNAGSTGSGGGYSQLIINVTPGQIITVTVPSGGAGGIGGGAQPTAGGTASIGAFISATGGGAGSNGTASGPGNIVSVPGIGVGGDFNITGGQGGLSFTSGTTLVVAAPGCAAFMPASNISDGDVAGVTGFNFGCAGRTATTISGLTLNGGGGSVGLVILQW
jgi:hypothetical protein